jgi:hypothetical protein
MARRALLIGSETEGLSGVGNDVEAMRTTLGRYDFDSVERRQAADASRMGILDGIRDLIGVTGQDDLALIYYSGHGGRVLNPDFTPEGGLPRYFQYLVPTDGNQKEFRGILSFELSLLLAELTAKTNNVVAILDCCHASRMARAAIQDVTQRALGAVPLPETVAPLLAKARERKIPLYPAGNPNVVRLLASEEHKTACEYETVLGKRMGAMTFALTGLLDSLEGVPTTWEYVGSRVRSCVRRDIEDQWPDVEGPTQRLLFDTREAPRDAAVAYGFDQARKAHTVGIGRALGARVGSVYGLMPVGAQLHDPDKALATLTITDVGLATSDVQVQLLKAPTIEDLPAGAFAYPMSVPFERRGVVVDGPPVDFGPLLDQLNQSRLLTLANPDESAIARLRLHDGKLHICRPAGFDIIHPLPAKSPITDAQAAKVIENLEAWARADAVSSLGQGDWPASVIDVRWGRVENAKPLWMSSGETMHVGDRFCLEIGNRGATLLYVGVINVGITGRITLLSSPNTGLVIPAEKTRRVDEDVMGDALGIPLSWNDAAPVKDEQGQALAESEHVLVIAVEMQQDFSLLRGDGMRVVRLMPKPLEDLFEHVGAGTTRSAPSPGGNYRIERITFNLSSTPRG